MRVVVSNRARAEAVAAVAWWRENRSAAPDLLATELAASISLIEHAPRVGRHVPEARRPGTRVLILNRTSYLLFYRVVDDDTIRVLALWHQRRGMLPRV